MKKLNVAVIGTGNMGENHLRVYSKLKKVNLVGFVEKNKRILKKFQKEYKIEGFETSKELLKNKKVDAVSIAVPTKLHKSISLKFLKNGIPCLIEKPIASNIKDALAIKKIYKKNKTKILIGHIERFNPAVQSLKKMIRENTLGKVYSVNTLRVNPFPQRMKHIDIITDLAIHDLDIITYLLDQKPSRVYCVGKKTKKSDLIDYACIMLNFPKNQVGVVNVNRVTARKIRKLTIIGSKAIAEMDYFTQEISIFKKVSYLGLENFTDLLLAMSIGEEKIMRISKQEPLEIELEHFVDCVLKNKKPFVTIDDGIFALKLAKAAIKSSKTSRSVKI